MKRLAKVIFIAAMLGVPAFADEPPQEPERVVYITNSGKRYHRADCRTLKNSKIEITISEAKLQGFTPCGICHPGD
jgi:hypothetical protein